MAIGLAIVPKGTGGTGRFWTSARPYCSMNGNRIASSLCMCISISARKAAEHFRHAGKNFRVASAVDGNHFIQAVAQDRQIQFQVLMVRSDDVLHQLIERCRLPVSTGHAGDLGLFDLPDDGLRLDALGEASLLKWLLPAAAVVQAVLLENANRHSTRWRPDRPKSW